MSGCGMDSANAQGVRFRFIPPRGNYQVTLPGISVPVIVRRVIPRSKEGYFIFFLILFIEKKLFYSIVVIIMESEGLSMDVTVNLHIKSHCIETEARNEFGRLMDRYFSTDDIEGELDEKIELLRDFLESSDFPKLRASDLRLSGGQESDVVIKRSEDGRITLDIL